VDLRRFDALNLARLPREAPGVANLSILLVEDDVPLANALSIHLRAEHWDVRWASSCAAATAEYRKERPDVALLDVMLPDGSGLDLCVALRRELIPCPGVLMLTARGSEADVVLGLDHGADDYVVKPCRPRELVARIRAVVRRARPATDAEGFERGKLRLDPLGRRAWIGPTELTLTPTEHELLTVLARETGKVHSRIELVASVFDSTHAGYARNVDCHVVRLRRKLEAAGLSPGSIKTVHGAGYRFEVV
jgi:DNA-binding response OmpR family regulator